MSLGACESSCAGRARRSPPQQTSHEQAPRQYQTLSEMPAVHPRAMAVTMESRPMTTVEEAISLFSGSTSDVSKRISDAGVGGEGRW